MTNYQDPHAQDSIGEVHWKQRPIPLIPDYEASGRFQGDPDAPPDPERMAMWSEWMDANLGHGEGSHVTDQLEAAYRLAESCSPRHELLRDPEDPDGAKSADWLLPWVFSAARKPKISAVDDVAQQIDNPLQTAATLIGHDQHVRVFTRADVVREALQFLPASSARKAQCGFCHRHRRAEGFAILLRGRGFWIDARLTCKRCQRRLNESAQRVGATLSWVRRDATD